MGWLLCYLLSYSFLRTIVVSAMVNLEPCQTVEPDGQQSTRLGVMFQPANKRQTELCSVASLAAMSANKGLSAIDKRAVPVLYRHL